MKGFRFIGGLVVMGALAIAAIGTAHKKGDIGLDTFPPKVHVNPAHVEYTYPTGN